MPSAHNNRSLARFWWPMVLLVAAFAYLYQLGGLHIPKIGDENVYFQITHRTADSGHWLPLQPADGLQNTKPPLLFWQGLVTTNWGSNWTKVRLRLPSVGYTALVGLLIFLLAERISRSRETAYISVASFLAFSSTFQHGRPFLVNMPETLFVFLPIFLFMYFRDSDKKQDWLIWTIMGLSLGIASLFKSFALIVPLGFCLAWMLFYQRDLNLFETIKNDSLKLGYIISLALVMFLLWPLMDPDPDSILKNFVMGENASKIVSQDYFGGLFSGPYPVWRIWFGHLTNAGLMAVPFIAIVIYSLKNRHTLSKDEKYLWIYVLAFIVVFTIPGQRQENYLLATVPALAILIGLNWKNISKTGLLISYLPLLFASGIILFLIDGIEHRVLPGSYGFFSYLPVVLALITILIGAANCKHTDKFIHLAIFLCFLSLSSLLAPFEGKHGSYGNEAQQLLAGKTVYVPSNFRSRYERHRFLLPADTRVVGYAPNDRESVRNWLEAGEYVAVNKPLTETQWPGYRIIGQRMDLRTRQTDEEVKQILFNRRFDLLFHREVILAREILKG